MGDQTWFLNVRNYLGWLIITGALISACQAPAGTATPSSSPEAEPTARARGTEDANFNTQVSALGTALHLTALAPTATRTPLPTQTPEASATLTPVPPATTAPPAATAAPRPTARPTPQPLPTDSPAPAMSALPTLPAEPRVLTFTVDPPAVYPGGTVTLTWQTTGEEVCIEQDLPAALFGPSLREAGSGSRTVTIGNERLWHAFMLTANCALPDVNQPRLTSRLVVPILCPYDYFFGVPTSPDNCPGTAAVYAPALEQLFEGGRMIWMQTLGEAPGSTIFVLYERNGQAYRVYADTWASDTPEPTPAATPPEGKSQPVRGFGKIWQDHPDVRERLGWALAPEQPFTGAYQHAWRAYYGTAGAAAFLRAADNQTVALAGMGDSWDFYRGK